MHTLKFLALSVLTLSVGLAADHPIIISGGSPLIIEHDRWNPKDKHNLGSTFHDHVTRVAIQWVTASGINKWHKDFTLGERLDLSLTYGTVQLTVTGNHDSTGQDIVVNATKSFPDDFLKQGNQYVRDETPAPITNVTVKKNNADLSAPPVSGHTEITVCYGTPDSNSRTECK